MSTATIHNNAMSPAELKSILDRLGPLGWTQARLAREIGVSRGAVCLWMKGRRKISNPAAILLRQIARQATSNSGQEQGLNFRNSYQASSNCAATMKTCF
jgi:DNA-binding transcriptional regulator YiaG